MMSDELSLLVDQVVCNGCCWGISLFSLVLTRVPTGPTGWKFDLLDTTIMGFYDGNHDVFGSAWDTFAWSRTTPRLGVWG